MAGPFPPEPSTNVEQVITPTPKHTVPGSRIVVVQSFYHQRSEEGHDAVAEGGNFVRWLGNDEQVYHPRRKVKVTSQWQEVDVGWVKTLGLLVISNLTPKPHMRAESLDSKVGVLEVCLSPTMKEEFTDDGATMWQQKVTVPVYAPHLLIPPGESYPMVPVPGNKVFIRSREGEGLYSAYAVEG